MQGFNFPLISVVIPTHRRATLLRRAITSVKSQNLSHSVEIIVVSDVVDIGTDTICANLLSKDDTYVRRSGTPGPSASRNLALDLARGSFVMFLDDDDAWQPNMLSQLLAHPQMKQRLPVYGDCEVINERRTAVPSEILDRRVLALSDRLNDQIFVKNQVHMSCYVLPREVIGNTRFDTYMRAYEDWEFLVHLYRKIPAQYVSTLISAVFQVPDASTDRRGSAPSATGDNALIDYLYVYRRHPAPDDNLKTQRAEFLRVLGISIDSKVL